MSILAGIGGLPGIGAVASPILGFMGVGDTNRANRDIASARNVMEIQEAKKARDFSSKEAGISRNFNAAQAAMNRKFTEQMSSSAVSRRMADMKKAGVNPILAGKFDASTPAGSMATSSPPATAKANAHGYTAQNKMQGLLSNMTTGLSIQKMIADINNLNASTDFTKRKTNLTDPINRAMDILDKIIEGGSGNLSDYKNSAAEIRNEILELRKYITGQNAEEADKIRQSPGIQLTKPKKKTEQQLRRQDTFHRGVRTKK